MIVVVLVGISAAMVAPALMRAMSISRATRCHNDLARLFRSARASAIGTGRAHLVDINPIGTDIQVSTYIGDSTSCQRSTWGGIVGAMVPVDSVWQSNYSPDVANGVRITVTAIGAPVPRQICFEPDGDRFLRPAPVGVFGRTAGVATVLVDRLEAGTPVDVQRQIVIPQFGTPRTVR